jgi:hypothetical protein
MHRVQSRNSNGPYQEPPGRLPLRWAVILSTAVMTSIPAGVLGGRPAAMGVFVMMAATLHLVIG